MEGVLQAGNKVDTESFKHIYPFGEATAIPPGTQAYAPQTVGNCSCYNMELAMAVGEDPVMVATVGVSLEAICD